MPKKVDKNLEELMQELDGNAINIENVKIMFLDVSSACVGYTVSEINFNKKKATITKCGCLWLGEKWPHAKKYNYIANSLLNYFWILGDIDYVVLEQYSVNPKKMMGVNVVSEMQGAIKASLWEHEISYSSILPQTWRSQLQIKALTTNGKRDFKGPTKNKVLEYMDIPNKTISNVTNKERNTPSDIYDSAAICLAWLKKYNINFKGSNNVQFNSHIGTLNI